MHEKTKKKEKVTKCRDHCHITGKYRGAACDKCNLRMRVPMFVPVLFHNLGGYCMTLTYLLKAWDLLKEILNVSQKQMRNISVFVKTSLWRMAKRKSYVWR